jgi:hypothetical protein
MMTHITTATAIDHSTSVVVVASAHRSITAAQRTGRTTLRLVDGAFGGRAPRVGDILPLYEEHGFCYAVRPR